MIYCDKLICISNYDVRLTINKQYFGQRFFSKSYYSDTFLYLIFDSNYNRIGIFSSNLFKQIKQYRNERLNDIIDEI